MTRPHPMKAIPDSVPTASTPRSLFPADPALRRSVLIAASGTVVEWFDYSLFFYLATSLSRTFYPGLDTSLLVVLGTGAVGFLFRPLGAVVFGHVGDTFGRTTALVTSAGLMALAMAGIALMPGYGTIGIWGGVGILVLRALAGFSVGAEYTGIMVYLMESAAPRRRGLTASWAAANSEIGALAAVGSAALVSALVGQEALHQWGWRLPFAVGAVLVALMIPLRHHMIESPIMQEALQRRAHQAPGTRSAPVVRSTHRRRWAQPLRYALAHQPRAILVSFLISTVGSATYFLTITYLPTYLESVQGGGAQAALNVGVLAAIVAVLISPLAGLASDHLGRRRSLALILAVTIVVVVPGYTALGSAQAGVVTLAALVLSVPAASWSAVAASTVPEQFSLRGRYSGMAVGYNMATVLFGGLTPPLVTWLMTVTEDARMPALFALSLALIFGIPAIALARETVPVSEEPEET